MVQDISFELHKGEILGFSGLMGAGRTETARAIFGADRNLSGEKTKDGKQVRGWAATVDWFFDHFQDVYEGKYTDTEEAKGQFHNWMSEWVNSGVVCKGE